MWTAELQRAWWNNNTYLHDANRHASRNPLLCAWTPVHTVYVNQNNFKCIQTSAQHKWCGSDIRTAQVMWFRHKHSISDVVQTSEQHKWCGSDNSTALVMWFRHQHSISDVVQTSAQHKRCRSVISTAQVMWFKHQHSISDVVQTSTQHKWCG